ncbi:hypothetical protein [Niabella hibiscisoli]|uniref:hypothetical protein n=1 Tax=Niabella hibiscisoli TaxID=1825928 RepID=UPI001F0EB074|nr:hypothetical protein [Niabella hibiscisoli]MCH5717503.1 hypothetical protein [Niabella hibiscisoli]
MNVIFHTVSAIGVVAMVTDTSIVKPDNYRAVTTVATIALFAAVFFHGVLDYMPHCYPVHSKWDVVIGLCIIATGTILVRKTYRLIVVAAFAGCILPDIIDLLPAISNKYMGWEIPIMQPIFPGT